MFTCVGYLKSSVGLESTETSSQPPFSKMVMKTYCAPPPSLSFFVGGILAFFYWPLMTISSFVSFLSPSRFFIMSFFYDSETRRGVKRMQNKWSAC